MLMNRCLMKIRNTSNNKNNPTKNRFYNYSLQIPLLTTHTITLSTLNLQLKVFILLPKMPLSLQVVLLNVKFDLRKELYLGCSVGLTIQMIDGYLKMAMEVVKIVLMVHGYLCRIMCNQNMRTCLKLVILFIKLIIYNIEY